MNEKIFSKSSHNIMDRIRKQKWLTYVAAFLIPALVIVGVMIRLGIAPFGDTSVFIWDAKLQYKDYYGYLWDLLHGDQSIQYFAGKSLGGRMISIISYYISSPLNLLMIFFKKSQISVFMSLLIIIKVGLSGLTSHFYLKKRFGLNFLSAICLSTAYGLMEYNIYYCRNIMWMEGVIMLPLVAYGVWKAVTEKKVVPLWLAVAVAIVSNWYTGYMVCLFSGFLFAYECCLYYDFHLIKEIKSVLKSCGVYIGTMIGGVLTSAFLLFPTLLGLVGSKVENNSVSGLTGIKNFDFIHFFSGFDIEAAGNSETAPVIYCGALLIFCTIYYFFDNRRTIRERVLSMLFLLFMIYSFIYRDIELLWTAYIQSNSYAFRFSFLFVFLCTILAGNTLAKAQEGGLKKSLSLFVLVFTGIIGGILSRLGELPLKNTVLAMIYGCLLMMAYDKSNDTPFWDRVCRVGAGAILLMITVTELFYNTEYSFKDYADSDQTYAEYTEAMEDVLNEIDETEDDFYRLDKNYSYLSVTGRDVASSESLLFGYNSIAHYSSAYDSAVDTFLRKVGYSDWVTEEVYPSEMYWNSPILLMDSLLSVKYTIMDVDSTGYEVYKTDSQLADESYSVYINQYALPLGYNIATDSEEEIEWTENPYENQELLVSSLLGEETSLYCYLDGVRQNSEEEAEEIKEIYEYTAEVDGPVYIYVDGTSIHSNYYIDNCELYVNGEKIQKICKRFLINSIYVGEYEAGDVIEVEIKHINTSVTADHTLYVAQLDMDAFESCINTLADGSESHLSEQGNTIEGTYTTTEDTIMFLSIPYEDAWTAYVDGEKVEIKNIVGNFMGIELTAGEHEIKLVYTLPGWHIGWILTAIGISSFIVVIVWKKRSAVISKKIRTNGEKKDGEY